MNIAPINPNNNTKYQNKTAFKGAEYFNAVKNIPGMVCACCGKGTINTEKFVAAKIPISKSLKYTMEQGKLNYIKRAIPAVFDKLEEIANKYPNMCLNEILEGGNEGYYSTLKKIIAKAYNQSETTAGTKEGIIIDRKIGEFFFDMVDRAHSYMKSSAEVVEGMMQFKPFLQGHRKDAFQQFEIYSRKYPNKTFAEIVNMDIIKNFHIPFNILQRTKAREELDYHYDNILRMVKDKKPSAVEYFQELKEKALDLYETERFDIDARRYYRNEMYKDAIHKFGLESLEDDIINELEQTTLDFSSVDSFFARAAQNNWDDGRMMSSIFNPFIESEEHIIAVANGGRDVIENKTVMHKICNAKIKGKTYPEFLKYHQDMPKHHQTMVGMAAKSIIEGSSPDYLRHYPIKVAKTLYDASEGIINLDMTDYCRKGIEKSKNEILRIGKELKSLTNQRDKMILLSVSDGNYSGKPDERIADIISQINALNSSLSYEQNLQRRMNEHIINIRTGKSF